MVFVVIGILFGPLGLDLFEVNIDSGLVRVITELTLILILFIDASTINARQLYCEKYMPIRLLFVGLPITMVFGSLIGWIVFPRMDIIPVVMMALILSPTDAALGQAVVKSRKVPEQVRRWINVESGLNDGIVLPFILVCIAALSLGAEHGGTKYWIMFLIRQLAFGALFGALIGWTGGWLIETMSARGLMNSTFQRLSAGSLALLCYAGAELFHGNGFIAAFFGGLMLGTITDEIRERIQEYGEAEGQQLTLFVFLGFALILVPKALPYWNIATWFYAILSLTVIRMLPVAISMIGTNQGAGRTAFIGWFGPRGIASVLYLVIVVGRLGVEGYEQPLAVVVLTVLLSIFLHGVTAVPLANRIGEGGQNIQI